MRKLNTTQRKHILERTQWTVQSTKPLSSKHWLYILKKKNKTILTFFFSCFKTITEQIPQFILSPHLQWLERKKTRRIPYMLVRKILFLPQFSFFMFYFSKKTLKFALSAKAHKGNVFPWLTVLTGTLIRL